MAFDLSCLDFSRKGKHFVPDMGDIEVQTPGHVICPDDVSAQNNLDTGVAHVTHIQIIAGISDRRRGIEREEHICRLAIEIIHTTGKTALEEAELNTCIEIGIGLPGDVPGTLLQPLICHRVIVVHNVIRVRIKEIADIVISLASD